MSTLAVDKLIFDRFETELAEERIGSATTVNLDSTVIFTDIPSDYAAMCLEWWDVETNTDGAGMHVRFSNDNGSSYLSGTNNHGGRRTKDNLSNEVTQGNAVVGTAQIYLQPSSNAMGNHTVNLKAAGRAYILNHGQAAYTYLHGMESVFERPTSIGAEAYTVTHIFGGFCASATVIDALRIGLSSSGTFKAGGEFRLYGLKE